MMQSVSELTVLDLGVGMAAALIAAQLRNNGAKIIRIEPEGGDPFASLYPAYSVWHQGSVRAAPAERETIARQADICIVGGEDYPGFVKPTADGLAALNRRLIVLDVQGDIGAGSKTPAVDLLMQARSGHCHEQFSGRPIATAFPAPTYGAALLGLVTIFAALIERERTDEGRVTTTSLRHGATIWWSGDWSSAETPDNAFNSVIPKDVRQLICRCRDGLYLHFVLGTPGSVAKVYKVLGIDEYVDPAERGLPDATQNPENYFFHDTDLFLRHVAAFDRQPLLTALWAAGIAAEAVEEPGAIWDEEQTVVNGFIVTRAAGGRHMGNPIAVKAVTGHAGAALRPAPARFRIVDLGSFLAGPYGSRILADAGADVIKIEPPGGDPNRYMQRSFASGARGKRSIGIDAKLPEGLALTRRICATADAVHHNFRPGVAARLGLDPAALRTLRADIVTLQSSAYGTRGPKAQNSGFDMIMQASCGLEYQGAGRGNAPLWYRSPIVDYAGGAIGTLAMLIGLFEKVRTGHGSDAETSLLGAGLFLISELVETSDGRFVGAQEMNADRTGFHPAEQLYRTEDGWIAVAARSGAMAADLAACLGLGDGLGPRSAWGEDASSRIGSALSGLTNAAALDRLHAAGVWAEPCVTDGWAAATSDPALRDNQLVGAIEQGHLGTVRFVDKLIDPDIVIGDRHSDGAVPKLGEHTIEILSEIGLPDAEIQDLYARKVIF